MTVSLLVIESALNVHTKDTINTRLCYFTLSSTFFYPFFTLQNPRIVSFIACKTTSVTSSTHGDPGVKDHMHNSLGLSLCKSAWLCKTDSRLHWGSKKSDDSLKYVALSAINNAFGVQGNDVQDIAVRVWGGEYSISAVKQPSFSSELSLN